jgi:hypothetical protein
MLLAALLGAIAALAAQGQTYKITGATSAPTSTTTSTTIPAGVDGVVLTLTGTLPTAQQQAASGLLGCFYTGYGSTAGIPLSLPNGTSTEPLVVPASTIQSIPQGSFTAANNYTVTAEIYIISASGTCNGAFNSDLTNEYAMQIVAPSLGAYSGATSIPQTNSATGVQAAPTTLALPANELLYYGAYGSTSSTTVTFGTFGSVALTVPVNYASVPVPAAFSSSAVGTTASLSICNTFAGGTGGYTVCTTPTPAITLTVAALVASTGTVAPTPTPVLSSGQTVLSAQFAISSSSTPATSPGAPSGTVSFTAPGATIPAAKLVLDTTATFSAQTSAVAATPAQLVFLVQPTNTSAYAPITPAVQVAIEDASGYLVANSTAAVTITIYENGSATPVGTPTTVNAVNGVATFSALSSSIVSTSNNAYLVAATGTLSAQSAFFSVTPPAITMTVQSTLIGIASTLSGDFTLSEPAPAGGVTVTLTSSAPANVTIAPATVSVAQGQTTGAFTYTGVAAGSATLSAAAASYQTGTVQATGTAAQVSLGAIPAVGPGQSTSLALSLPTPAPPGGTTVTFTSSDTTIATVTASVTVPAGQQTAATNPQVTGILIGTSTITASAPGYAPATRTATVTVTATFNPSTTQINLSTSNITTLNISSPAPVGGITFALQSSATSIVTVPASVTLVQGATSVPVPITGVSAGTATISATSAGVTTATGTVVVYSAINGGSFTTGYDLESYVYINLPVSPPNPTTVTVTSNNPAVAIISASSTAVGQTTLTFPNVTSSSVGQIFVQGLSVGTTTLTISAPGYTDGTTAITVSPTGFVYYGTPNISTTTFSAPSTATIYAVPLVSGTLAVYNYGYNLNPGSASISVPVTSSNTAVGNVTSPVVFPAGASTETTSFQPVGVGTTNVTIGTPPAGFSVASQYEQITATVSAPVISVGNVTTGAKLQNGLSLYLPVAPPAPVTVTVSVPATAGVATLSNSTTVAGVTTLTFMNVTSTFVGTIYVQGQTVGSTTVTVSAPGYTSGSGTITVDPSGFFIYPSNISTTTFSGTSSVTVYSAILNPGTLTINDYGYYLNPGVSVTVPITSSATGVGTLSSSSLAFSANSQYAQTNFQPVAAGTSTIALGATPTGFSTATQDQSITATVTAPAITVGSVLTGVSLQNTISIYLPVAPPSPVTVTVSVPAGTVVPATISNSATVAGVTTLTFMNVSSSNVGTIYVQGQSVGSSTLTVAAPGYTSGTSTLTVDPSGFFIYPSNISTTTFSGTSTVTVYNAILNPGTLTVNNYGYIFNPGVAPVTVPVTDSTPSVGTLSATSLVFAATNYYAQTIFQPVSAGTSTIALGATPAGFSTPSNDQSITATVTAPAISVGNTVTGLNLENTLYISLPVAPPNPVTVTVTSNGPAIATISNSGTVVGGTTLTFTNVTGTNLGNIYVQGQSLGSTTLTVSAPGYTNGIGTITVYPSGFVFVNPPNITTTATSNPSTFYVYTATLNPGTLTIYNYEYGLNPGIGNVSVPVVSSNTAVGTITTSPLVFTPGTAYLNTGFQPVATGTSAISITPPAGFSTPSQNTQGSATVQ